MPAINLDQPLNRTPDPLSALRMPTGRSETTTFDDHFQRLAAAPADSRPEPTKVNNADAAPTTTVDNAREKTPVINEKPRPKDAPSAANAPTPIVATAEVQESNPEQEQAETPAAEVEAISVLPTVAEVEVFKAPTPQVCVDSSSDEAAQAKPTLANVQTAAANFTARQDVTAVAESAAQAIEAAATPTVADVPLPDGKSTAQQPLALPPTKKPSTHSVTTSTANKLTANEVPQEQPPKPTSEPLEKDVEASKTERPESRPAPTARVARKPSNTNDDAAVTASATSAEIALISATSQPAIATELPAINAAASATQSNETPQVADSAPTTPQPIATNDSPSNLPPQGTPSTPLGSQSAVASRVSQNTSSGTSDVDRVRFVQRVSKALQSAGEGNGHLRLRLSPPELGAVRVEVSIKDGVMTARLEAETSSARAALLDSLPQLQHRMSEHGLRLERFEVDLADQGNSGGTGGNSTGESFADRQDGSSQHRPLRPTNQRQNASSAPTPARVHNADQLNVVI